MYHALLKHTESGDVCHDGFFGGFHNSANNAEGSDFEVFEGTVEECSDGCAVGPVRKGKTFEHELDRGRCNGEHADVVDQGWFWEDAESGTLSKSFLTADAAHAEAIDFYRDRQIGYADHLRDVAREGA